MLPTIIAGAVLGLAISALACAVIAGRADEAAQQFNTPH